MGKPGKGIRKIVKKYAVTREYISYDRDDTTFTGGIEDEPVPRFSTIKIHVQPLGSGDLIDDLPEGQRQRDVNRGWTLDTIEKKDQVIIGSDIHTINAIQVWPESQHTECDLLRTGERDNILGDIDSFKFVTEDNFLILSEDGYIITSNEA